MNCFRFNRQYFSLPAALLLAVAGAASAGASTPVEQMSQTVETLCPALKGANTANPAALSQAEKDVLLRCGELKRAPGQSLSQLSSDQLNGLDNMTSEESSVMGTSTVELSGAQNVAILGRLTLLRAKTTNSVASAAPPQKPNHRGGENDSNVYASMSPATANLFPATVDESLARLMSGYEGGFSQMSDYGKWGFFVNGSYGLGEKDETANEPGFEFDSYSLVTGVDYRLNEQLVLGLALSYAMTDSQVDNNGGDVDLDGFGAAVYGSYYLGEMYFDFIGGFGAKDYDTKRNLSYSVAAKAGGTTVVNQSFNGSTDATDVNVSLGTGYNVSFSGFSVTPFAQLSYLKSDIDGYTESLQGANSDAGFGLALALDDQEIESLASTVGFQVAKTINTSSGVLTPYVRADWEHEFENDARNIAARFAAVDDSYSSLNTIIIPTDDPDRDFFNLGAGISAVLPGGYQFFFDYSTIVGYEDISLHRFTAGVRFEF